MCVYGLCISNHKIIQFDSYDEITIRTSEDPNNITKINEMEIIKQFEDIINQAELTEINNTDENGWIILCNIYKNKQIKNTIFILNNTICFDKITYKNNTSILIQRHINLMRMIIIDNRKISTFRFLFTLFQS